MLLSTTQSLIKRRLFLTDRALSEKVKKPQNVEVAIQLEFQDQQIMKQGSKFEFADLDVQPYSAV